MMLRNLFYIVLLVCYYISSITTATSFTPRLEYINYISSSAGSYSINYNGETTTKVFSILMQSDDSPLKSSHFRFRSHSLVQIYIVFLLVLMAVYIQILINHVQCVIAMVMIMIVV